MAWKEQKHLKCSYNRKKATSIQAHHTRKVGIFRGAMVRGFRLISGPCQVSEIILFDPKGTNDGPLKDFGQQGNRLR